MKRLALILLACLTLPAPAMEMEGNVITLSDHDMQECHEGGGCVVVSRQQILDAIEEQSRKMAGSCGNRT